MELEPQVCPSFLKDALSYGLRERDLEVKRAWLAIFENDNNINSRKTMGTIHSVNSCTWLSADFI